MTGTASFPQHSFIPKISYKSRALIKYQSKWRQQKSNIILFIFTFCLPVKSGDPRGKLSIVRRSGVGRIIIRPKARSESISKSFVSINAKWKPIFTPIHSSIPFPWVSQWRLNIPEICVKSIHSTRERVDCISI